MDLKVYKTRKIAKLLPTDNTVGGRTKPAFNVQKLHHCDHLSKEITPEECEQIRSLRDTQLGLGLISNILKKPHDKTKFLKL